MDNLKERNRRSFEFTHIFNSLGNLEEFNSSFRNMLLKGWFEDGETQYIPNGEPKPKIIAIQRFKRPIPDNPELIEIGLKC